MSRLSCRDSQCLDFQYVISGVAKGPLSPSRKARSMSIERLFRNTDKALSQCGGVFLSNPRYFVFPSQLHVCPFRIDSPGCRENASRSSKFAKRMACFAKSACRMWPGVVEFRHFCNGLASAAGARTIFIVCLNGYTHANNIYI